MAVKIWPKPDPVSVCISLSRGVQHPRPRHLRARHVCGEFTQCQASEGGLEAALVPHDQHSNVHWERELKNEVSFETPAEFDKHRHIESPAYGVYSLRNLIRGTTKTYLT